MRLNPRWTLLPLRLLIGFGFAAHGLAKLERGPESFAAALSAMGVPAPVITAWITALLEFVGGILVMAGVWVVPLSIPLAIIMLVALFKVHWPFGFSSIKLVEITANGPQFGKPGYEVNLLYLCGLLTLVLEKRARGPEADRSRRRRLGPLSDGGA